MKIKRFYSAYPGSMFEKPEGGYVEFNDVDSLASALVKNYDDMRRSVDDWTDTAIQNEKRAQIAEQQRDELLEGAKLLIEQYDSSGDFTMGGQLTNKPFSMLKAAIAKVEGGAA